VVPPHTPHGFHTHTETMLEVIAEQAWALGSPRTGTE
jgi:hypothetical protein